VLLTGFEPFDGAETNPSQDVIAVVSESWTGPERLITAVLPVSFDRSAAALADLLAEHEPDVVIATGLAGGRTAVSVERIAVNLIDARIPDADGVHPVNAQSINAGDLAALSTLPVKAIHAAIDEAGIPVELSLSAGLYVCNHVFMHLTAWAGARAARAGFIHLPWAIGQASAGEPELPIEQLVEALRIAVRVSLDTPSDLSVPSGPIA
jgi:pyroglutamyl-peptidase